MTADALGGRIFGTVAPLYAKHRLHYPVELFEYISALCPGRDRALDLGTGNGQAAIGLARYFAAVDATDSNEEQLRNAFAAENVVYHLDSAESSTLPSGEYDLITVAMAVHWFNLEEFYAAVRRLLKPSGILAVFGYSSPDAVFSEKIGEILRAYLNGPIDEFWAPQVRLLIDGYADLDFPFPEVDHPEFFIEREYTAEEWIGLASTWSAVKLYESQRDSKILEILRSKLHGVWTSPEKVILPLHTKIGRIDSHP